MSSREVIWHDLECGGYEADLPLWRELAAGADGPVLDVGAGSGRVALDLARQGHDVVALDAESSLLEALHARADGLPVETVTADARAFALGRAFPLAVVPMQTAQILGGPAGRAAFLACAREHLAPGGVLAVAIADVLEGVGGEYTEPPLPDLCEIDGVVYSSRPVAVWADGPRVAIQRVREIVDAGGGRHVSDSVVWLDALDAGALEEEARSAGLRPLPSREVAQTDEYVGSTVVMLGA